MKRQRAVHHIDYRDLETTPLAPVALGQTPQEHGNVSSAASASDPDSFRVRKLDNGFREIGEPTAARALLNWARRRAHFRPQ